MRYLISIICFISISAYACTDFRMVAADNTVMVSRSMEFADDLQSVIATRPVDSLFQSLAPNNKPAQTWRNRYGYVYLNGFKQMVALDGLNEKGLSFEYLYLPGYTKYMEVPPGKEKDAVPYFYFGDWILGNFASVAEVREALKQVYIYGQGIASLNNIVYPVHAVIYDTTGQGIVVEFVDGHMQVSESMGVMTNSPPYAWHVTALRNYLNLSPMNPEPQKVGSYVLSALGQGTGAIGLPGDASPSSRFAKIAFLAKTVYPVQDAMSLLVLSNHMLNTVDIPKGFTRAVEDGKEYADYPQWVVFKDLTHRILYYRSYDDITIRALRLQDLDMRKGAQPRMMPIAHTTEVVDMTKHMVPTV